MISACFLSSLVIVRSGLTQPFRIHSNYTFIKIFFFERILYLSRLLAKLPPPHFFSLSFESCAHNSSVTTCRSNYKYAFNCLRIVNNINNARKRKKAHTHRQTQYSFVLECKSVCSYVIRSNQGLFETSMCPSPYLGAYQLPE